MRLRTLPPRAPEREPARAPKARAPCEAARAAHDSTRASRRIGRGLLRIYPRRSPSLFERAKRSIRRSDRQSRTEASCGKHHHAFCGTCMVGSPDHCPAGQWCNPASPIFTGGQCTPHRRATDPQGSECMACRDVNTPPCVATGAACASAMVMLRQCYEATAPGVAATCDARPTVMPVCRRCAGQRSKRSTLVYSAAPRQTFPASELAA